MLGISLIFVGVTLILNGVYLLWGKKTKSLAIVNLFTAGIIFIFNLYAILTTTDEIQLVGYVGGLLFGLTNLLIAFDLLFKNDNRSTGFFSLIATTIAISLSVYYFFSANIFRGVAWVIWSLIWLFAYIGFALNKKFIPATSIMFIIQGIVTTGIFGLLQLFQIIQF